MAELGVWLNPVTDRTYKDVQRVKELNTKMMNCTATPEEVAEWNSDMKGALNKFDVRRITSNLIYLNMTFEFFLQTDEYPLDFPLEWWFESVVTDIDSLIFYRKLQDKYTVPTLPLNSYDKINIVEQVIAEIGMPIQINHYCGDDKPCGDMIGLL